MDAYCCKDKKQKTAPRVGPGGGGGGGGGGKALVVGPLGEHFFSNYLCQWHGHTVSIHNLPANQCSSVYIFIINPANIVALHHSLASVAWQAHSHSL